MTDSPLTHSALQSVKENLRDDMSEEDFLAHYGTKGMKWGVTRMARKQGGASAYAYARQRDAGWRAKVEANPKLGKISSKAARDARKQTRLLKKSFKAANLNIKKDRLARQRYDTELKNILNESVSRAAYKVHGNSPSRLNEVSIHRHPDGSITAIIQPRNNAKILKQKGKIAKRDAKNAARDARSVVKQLKAKEKLKHDDMVVDDLDLAGMSFILLSDSEGYVNDIYVPGEEDLSHSDAVLDFLYELDDDELAHFGVKGMKWGVRRRTGSDGLVVGGVKKTKSKTSSPPADSKGHVQRKRLMSKDHRDAVDILVKRQRVGNQGLSDREAKELTARVEAIKKLDAVLDPPRKSQLQQTVERMKLEKEYNALMAERTEAEKSSIRKVAEKVVSNAVDQAIKDPKGTAEAGAKLLELFGPPAGKRVKTK